MEYEDLDEVIDFDGILEEDDGNPNYHRTNDSELSALAHHYRMQNPENDSNFLMDSVRDVGRGVIGLADAAVGIADFAQTAVTGESFRPTIEEWGWRPDQWDRNIARHNSFERQMQDARVQSAEGLDVISEYLTNPRALAGAAIQQIPNFVGMGAAARGAAAYGMRQAAKEGAERAAAKGLKGAEANAYVERFAAKAGPAYARGYATTGASAAEGAITTGSVASAIGHNKAEDGEAADRGDMMYAGAAGLATAGIGKFMGKYGADAEAAIGARMAGTPLEAVGKSRLGRLHRSMRSEGIEEALQSGQETAMTNLGSDDPWHQDVIRSMGEGAVLGGVMGGAMHPFHASSKENKSLIGGNTTAGEAKASEEADADAEAKLAEAKLAEGRIPADWEGAFNSMKAINDDRNALATRDSDAAFAEWDRQQALNRASRANAAATNNPAGIDASAAYQNAVNVVNAGQGPSMANPRNMPVGPDVVQGGATPTAVAVNTESKPTTGEFDHLPTTKNEGDIARAERAVKRTKQYLEESRGTPNEATAERMYNDAVEYYNSVAGEPVSKASDKTTTIDTKDEPKVTGRGAHHWTDPNVNEVKVGGKARGSKYEEGTLTRPGSAPDKWNGQNISDIRDPKGGAAIGKFYSENGSEYVYTNTGMTRRVKFHDSKTGGKDAGVNEWRDTVFMEKDDPLYELLTHENSRDRLLAFPGRRFDPSTGKLMVQRTEGGEWTPFKLSDAVDLEKVNAGQRKMGAATFADREYSLPKTTNEPKNGRTLVEFTFGEDGNINGLHASGGIGHVEKEAGISGAKAYKEATKKSEAIPTAAQPKVVWQKPKSIGEEQAIKDEAAAKKAREAEEKRKEEEAKAKAEADAKKPSIKKIFDDPVISGKNEALTKRVRDGKYDQQFSTLSDSGKDFIALYFKAQAPLGSDQLTKADFENKLSIASAINSAEKLDEIVKTLNSNSEVNRELKRLRNTSGTLEDAKKVGDTKEPAKQPEQKAKPVGANARNKLKAAGFGYFGSRLEDPNSEEAENEHRDRVSDRETNNERQKEAKVEAAAKREAEKEARKEDLRTPLERLVKAEAKETDGSVKISEEDAITASRVKQLLNMAYTRDFSGTNLRGTYDVTQLLMSKLSKHSQEVLSLYLEKQIEAGNNLSKHDAQIARIIMKALDNKLDADMRLEAQKRRSPLSGVGRAVASVKVSGQRLLDLSSEFFDYDKLLADAVKSKAGKVRIQALLRARDTHNMLKDGELSMFVSNAGDGDFGRTDKAGNPKPMIVISPLDKVEGYSKLGGKSLTGADYAQIFDNLFWGRGRIERQLAEDAGVSSTREGDKAAPEIEDESSYIPITAESLIAEMKGHLTAAGGSVDAQHELVVAVDMMNDHLATHADNVDTASELLAEDFDKLVAVTLDNASYAGSALEPKGEFKSFLKDPVIDPKTGEQKVDSKGRPIYKSFTERSEEARLDARSQLIEGFIDQKPIEELGKRYNNDPGMYPRNGVKPLMKVDKSGHTYTVTGSDGLPMTWFVPPTQASVERTKLWGSLARNIGQAIAVNIPDGEARAVLVARLKEHIEKYYLMKSYAYDIPDDNDALEAYNEDIANIKNMAATHLRMLFNTGISSAIEHKTRPGIGTWIGKRAYINGENVIIRSGMAEDGNKSAEESLASLVHELYGIRSGKPLMQLPVLERFAMLKNLASNPLLELRYKPTNGGTYTFVIDGNNDEHGRRVIDFNPADMLMPMWVRASGLFKDKEILEVLSSRPEIKYAVDNFNIRNSKEEGEVQLTKLLYEDSKNSSNLEYASNRLYAAEAKLEQAIRFNSAKGRVDKAIKELAPLVKDYGIARARLSDLRIQLQSSMKNDEATRMDIENEIAFLENTLPGLQNQIINATALAANRRSKSKNETRTAEFNKALEEYVAAAIAFDVESRRLGLEAELTAKKSESITVQNAERIREQDKAAADLAGIAKSFIADDPVELYRKYYPATGAGYLDTRMSVRGESVVTNPGKAAMAIIGKLFDSLYVRAGIPAHGREGAIAYALADSMDYIVANSGNPVRARALTQALATFLNDVDLYIDAAYPRAVSRRVKFGLSTYGRVEDSKREAFRKKYEEEMKLLVGEEDNESFNPRYYPTEDEIANLVNEVNKISSFIASDAFSNPANPTEFATDKTVQRAPRYSYEDLSKSQFANRPERPTATQAMDNVTRGVGRYNEAAWQDAVIAKIRHNIVTYGESMIDPSVMIEASDTVDASATSLSEKVKLWKQATKHYASTTEVTPFALLARRKPEIAEVMNGVMQCFIDAGVPRARAREFMNSFVYVDRVNYDPSGATIIRMPNSKWRIIPPRADAQYEDKLFGTCHEFSHGILFPAASMPEFQLEINADGSVTPVGTLMQDIFRLMEVSNEIARELNDYPLGNIAQFGYDATTVQEEILCQIGAIWLTQPVTRELIKQEAPELAKLINDYIQGGPNDPFSRPPSNDGRGRGSTLRRQNSTNAQYGSNGERSGVSSESLRSVHSLGDAGSGDESNSSIRAYFSEFRGTSRTQGSDGSGSSTPPQGTRQEVTEKSDTLLAKLANDIPDKVSATKEAAISKLPEGPARDFASLVADKFGGAGKAFLGGLRLGGSFLNDIANNWKEALPSLGDLYRKLKDKEYWQNARQTVLAKFGSRANAFDRQTYDAVNSVLERSTLHNIWVYKPSYMTDEQWAKHVQTAEELKSGTRAQLLADYDALPDGAKQYIRDVFTNTHNALLEKVAIAKGKTQEIQNLIDELPDGPDKEILKADMKAAVRQITRLNEQSIIPYAPLSRSGDHAVVGQSAEYKAAIAKRNEMRENKANWTPEDKKAYNELVAEIDEMRANSKHYVVEFVNGAGNAEHAARKMRTAYPSLDVEPFERAPEDHGNPINYLSINALESALSSRLKDKTDNPENRAMLRRMLVTLNDIYIDSLSSTHTRKHELHREGVAGYNKDIIANFLDQGNREIHYLANVKYNSDLNKLQNKLFEEAAKPEGKTSKKDRMKVYAEVAKRLQLDYDHKENGTIEVAQRTTSVMMLLLSPAYYLQNATQPFMMSAPYMAGQYNITTVLGNMATNMKEFIKAYKDGGRENSTPDFDKMNFLSPAELRGLKYAQEHGLLDIGMSQDFGHLLNPSLFQKFTDKLSVAARLTETLNRAATFKTAFDLKYNETGDEAAARDYGIEVLYETHGDYSSTNAPRFFKQGGLGLGGAEKLIFQFRKFQLIQLGMMGRLFKNMLMNADANERKVARHALGYVFGMHLAFTGVKGAPLAMTVMWLLGALGLGDEDDNEEDVIREAIGDKDTADLILGGIPAALGMDVSNRIGAGNMLSPFPYLSARPWDGREGFYETFAAFGGPAVAQMARAAEGANYIASGDLMKGIELFMPNGLTNVMRAIRYSTEGYTTKNGTVTIPSKEFSEMEAFFQAIGLPTSVTTDRFRLQDKLIRSETHFSEEENRLNKEFRAAKTKFERLAVQREYLTLQRERAEAGFKPKSVTQLLKNEQRVNKDAANAIGGVVTNNTNRAFVAYWSQL